MPLPYEIHTARLDNGLQVVLNPDPAIPLVAVNLWVGVGSRHEHPDRTGFAHLFEHLMFQGSEHVAEGEHFAALMAQGAKLNATTSFDRTNYFETVPTGALDLALWLEADRHGGLLPALTQANFDNQRDVVKEEKRQRNDNVPYGDAFERMFKLVFPNNHPYQHLPIGSMEHLDAASLDEVQAFYRAHYRPSNTVLTLAGDVTVDHGLALAEKYFGHLTDPASGAVPTREEHPALPPLDAPQEQQTRADVPHERLYLAFRLPGMGDETDYLAATTALDVLAGLGHSRLDAALVRGPGLATAVHASWVGLIENTSVGFIALEVPPGGDAARIREVVSTELERLAADGPTAEEIEATASLGEYVWLHSLASLAERADHLSENATLFGDATRVTRYVDTLRGIGVNDVTAATRRWLKPESVAVLHYLPEGA